MINDVVSLNINNERRRLLTSIVLKKQLIIASIDHSLSLMHSKKFKTENIKMFR